MGMPTTRQKTALLPDDAARLAAFLSHLEKGKHVVDSSAGLACIDAVLSINRRYDPFVTKRKCALKSNYARTLEPTEGPLTLPVLHALTDKSKGREFCQLWDYADLMRVQLLHRLAERLIRETGGCRDQQTEFRLVREWALAQRPTDFSTFGVKGIGLATFQYLRKRLGVSTVKPDRRLLRVVIKELGHSVGDLEAIEVVAAAAQIRGWEAAEADSALWNLGDKKAPTCNRHGV